VGLASAAVILFVAWIGWQLAASVQTRATDILRVSFFWIYIAMPVGCVGIAFYMLVQAIRNIRLLAKGDTNG
jgi:TRAP-type transport system small permease protein